MAIILKSKEEMDYLLKKNLKLILGNNKKRVENMMAVEFIGFSDDRKSLTLSFPVLEWELNPLGIMHGGIITAAFDNTYGSYTHCIAENKFITTVNISTSFLKPVNLDDSLIITVKANSIGKTIISMTGEGYLKSSGILAATSSATFMILDREFDFSKN